jgi:hypothetical protein
MIEGFTNSSLSPASPVTGYQAASSTNDFQASTTGFQPTIAYQPFMKSDCSYAAQPCMYTAQGEMICPKEGLGNCGSSLKYKK